MAKSENHSNDIESGASMRYNSVVTKPNRKGLAAIYRQEIIQDVTLFIFQNVAAFYNKLFQVLGFELHRANTGRRVFPKESMVCASLVIKCEGFSQVTGLKDYLDSNRIIAHYCGFDIMKPLPSYWTYDRFLRQLDNAELTSVMAELVQQLYKLGVVDASFIGLDSTPVMASTKQNNPKFFVKTSFLKKNPLKVIRTVRLASTPPLTITVNAGMSSIGVTRAMYW